MNLKEIIKNKEIKNAGWLISGRIVQMIMSFFVGILTARYLGPSNYGLISYGGAYVSFFTSLCTLGINSVIIKDFVENPSEQGEAIGSSLLMRLISSILSILMILGIVLILDKDDPLSVIVVFLCSLGTLFNVFDTFNYWFQYQYKSKITSIATLCAYIITSIYRIILLILGLNVKWFAFATSVDYIVIAIFLIIAYKKYNGSKLKFSIKKSKSLLKLSYNYILSSIMVSLYGQTDKLMIKQILNETEVGYYATATAICAMWTFVLQAIIDSLYPTILKLKNVDQKSYEKKNKQLYALVFYISLFVSLIFLTLGDFIVKYLYGESYMASADILKVVTFYTAFSYLGVARNAWIVSENKQKYLKYMYGSAVIINIGLNALMIPLIGGVGAAIASLITQIFTSIVLPLFFKEMRPNAKLIIDAIILKNIK